MRNLPRRCAGWQKQQNRWEAILAAESLICSEERAVNQHPERTAWEQRAITARKHEVLDFLAQSQSTDVAVGR
jgi:hypothetical protein